MMNVDHDETRRNVLRNALALSLVGLVFLSLWVWHRMPIYPDEMALKIQVQRYIPDHGIIYGLYALCTSNIKHVPLAFLLPAWSLSVLDQHFSAVQLRVLPFTAIAASICLAVWYSLWRDALFAAAVACTGLIGVAGSSLVMGRPEYFHAINLAACLAAYMFIESGSRNLLLRCLFISLLSISILFSMYVHVQGILFLPLTLYFVYRLICISFEKKFVAILIFIILAFGTLTEMNFYHRACREFPAILNFWGDMTFRVSIFKTMTIFKWLGDKIIRYVHPFLYRQDYSIGYLPPAGNPAIPGKVAITALNIGIAIVVPLNFILAIFITARVTIRTLLDLIQVNRNHGLFQKWWGNNTRFVPLLLFAWPVLFLFFYDEAQNFYRSIFINFILSIFIAICLFSVAQRRRSAAKIYSIFCATLLVGSISANFLLFRPALANGYEGPSVSLNHDPAVLNREIATLVQQGKMDLSKGRIIFDDMTYDSVKQYARLYPVTYLVLQAEVTGIEVDETLNRLKPNYAIAKCTDLGDIKRGQHYQNGDLCAIDFNAALPPR